MSTKTEILHSQDDDGLSRQDASMESSVSIFERERIHPALSGRRDMGSLRSLVPFHEEGTMDFSSNDYLGLAQNQEQHEKVHRTYDSLTLPGNAKHHSLLGSTGSRLLTGDSQYAQTLEQRLAKYHRRPAALLCNSGYDANLSVLSCLTSGAVVLMDELAHNSLQMGVRLSKDCTVHQFLHNNLNDLQRWLQKYHASSQPVLVVVESVYSMDGDIAPLKEILDLSLQYDACVIVDEAHGLGVFGRQGMGVLERDSLENHPALLCSIHTFGKAAGCHGAVICGSISLKDYLLNYGRPIIYSTSLPIHSLVTIACSYQSMASEKGHQLRQILNERINLFRHGMAQIMQRALATIGLVESISPIQALIIPGNTLCVEFCSRVLDTSNKRIRLYPIRSPTVPKGQERVRIIIHSHNSPSEIERLLSIIEKTLYNLGFLQPQSKL